MVQLIFYQYILLHWMLAALTLIIIFWRGAKIIYIFVLQYCKRIVSVSQKHHRDIILTSHV